MQPPLKNANGYRSPYINALNAAATANEVVAGDLLIRRTPQGTTLRVPPRPRLRRFRISIGLNGTTPVAILSEGNLILQSGPATLLPGKDVAWSDTATPTPGWCSAAIPETPGHWLDFILAKHIPTDSVYVIAQPGNGDAPDTPLHQLLPADLGNPTEADVSAIVTIGRVHIPPSTSSNPSKALQISQHIADDIPALGISSPTPFNHRFKVTAESVTDDNGQTSVSVRVSPGTIWERVADTLAPIGLTPVAPLAADGDGWKVDNATSASLYVTEKDDGAHEIKFSDPDAETDAIILRIADITVTTSDPPVVTILQRQIGDFVLAAPGQEETPVAWRVALRKKEVSSGTIDQWQIFAPTWTVGRETLLPEGMAEDWNDLDIHSGDLYAVLTWTGTATTDDAGEVQTTWTPGKPTIVNSLSDIPPDEDPTPDDPGTSTIEGKEGHRSIIVKIGTFLTEDNPPPESEEPDTPAEGEEPDTIGFLQIHTGSIIEDINTSTPATAAMPKPDDWTADWKVQAFDEEQEDGTKKKVWKIWSPRFIYRGLDGYWHYRYPSGYTKGWNTLQDQPTLNTWRDLSASITWTETVVPKNATKYVEREIERCIMSATVPKDSDPTRYTPGRKSIIVGVGRWRTANEWFQDHLGPVIVQFPIYSPFHERVEVPVSLNINGDGQLEVAYRTTEIPNAGSGTERIVKLNLPSGGGASDVLGPIEWDASQNAYVQYLGKWTWTGSTWTFAKKMNGSTAYPPAAIYPITAAQLLVRSNRYGNPDAKGDNIAIVPFNLPFASATATNWLSRRESTVSNGVVYTPPETVDGSGSLDSKTFTITYWSDTGETNRQTNNLLGSIVEQANQTSTYEG